MLASVDFFRLELTLVFLDAVETAQLWAGFLSIKLVSRIYNKTLVTISTEKLLSLY